MSCCPKLVLEVSSSESGGRAGGVLVRGWRCPRQGLEVSPSGAEGVLVRGWRFPRQGLGVSSSGAGDVLVRGASVSVSSLDVSGAIPTPDEGRL